MASLVPIYGYEAVVQISEDGGTTYTASAIINTNRGITITSETENDEIIDADDQSAPAQMFRRVRVTDFKVDGAGMAQSENIKYWADWALGGEAKSVKVIVSDLTMTGEMVLTSFSVSGERAKTMEFSCTLEQAGPMTATTTV